MELQSLEDKGLEDESHDPVEVVVLTNHDRQKAFMELAIHLRTLCSLQDSMLWLAKHMEVLLRQSTPLAPSPIRPQRVRRLNQDSMKSVLGESHPLLQTLKGVENLHDASQELVFPLVSEQCGSEHWKLVSQVSQDLGDGLYRVTQIVTDEQVTDTKVQKSQKRSVWTMQLLQRDLESLIPLVRCAGKLCWQAVRNYRRFW